MFGSDFVKLAKSAYLKDLLDYGAMMAAQELSESGQTAEERSNNEEIRHVLFCIQDLANNKKNLPDVQIFPHG